MTFSLVAIAALLAACGKSPAPAEVEVIDTVVINDHNTLTQDLARALERTRLLEEDAAVLDLAGRETYEHDAFALARQLEAAQNLAAKVENAPLPGDKAKVRELSSAVRSELASAAAAATAFDQQVRDESAPADKQALADKAAMIGSQILQAAGDHAKLVADIVSVSKVDMVIWDEILPQHELAFHRSRALWHAANMLGHDSSDKSWADYWKREADAMSRHIAAASAALPAVEAKSGEAARAGLAEMKKLEASAKEHADALVAELAKAKPDFEKAKEQAEQAREDMAKAEAEHRRIAQHDKTKPYPQYDFNK
ncbi:MAG: hypothetical protein KDC27_20410 [Acidobacteria bacterium]|nr:hypothetical protein [Acidobacteriota bacterium]